MRKLHWISMALIAAPFALAGACGGDDTTGGGAAGTSTGSSGSGTAGTSSSGGSAGSTTGSSGSAGSTNTAGSLGTGGSGTGGTTGGMAGTAAPDSGGAGTASKDAATETAVDDGSSTKCTVATDPANGKSCADYCTAFYKVCTARPVTMNTYTSPADCVTKCKAFNQSQLCCRAQHAVTVAANPDGGTDYLDAHCGHTIGIGLCQN
jgi:hypothetical protein